MNNLESIIPSFYDYMNIHQLTSYRKLITQNSIISIHKEAGVKVIDMRFFSSVFFFLRIPVAFSACLPVRWKFVLWWVSHSSFTCQIIWDSNIYIPVKPCLISFWACGGLWAEYSPAVSYHSLRNCTITLFSMTGEHTCQA